MSEEFESDLVVDEGAPELEAEVEVKSKPTNPITDLPEDEEKVEDKPKEVADPKGVQKRIDRAVRQKYEAEARTKILEERLSSLEKANNQPREQERQIQNDSEPTLDKFDSFDEYMSAKIEWNTERKILQTLEAREQRAKADSEATEHRKTVDGWKQRVEAYTSENSDFEEILASSDLPLTKAMESAIMESDLGPQVAYFLATNPDEATAIAKMTPSGAIRALGRIEERLANSAPAKKTTSAPPPIKSVGSTASVKKDPGKMSDEEYAKWRKSGKT